ncbi:MAG: hypothetical protein K1X87_07490 [Dehalococcoidia bacterium]|nr:hypothetical protein [Dehalococcoidia bacterium]
MMSLRWVRLGSLAALAAVTVTATAALLPTAAGAEAPPKPNAACWAAPIDGRPAQLQAGGTEGWYIWNDGDGFHLASTKPVPAGKTFTAVLMTDGKFTDVSRIRLEGADLVHTKLKGHQLIVAFRTHDGIDGVNFHVDGGQRLRFTLREGKHRIAANEIYVGAGGAHPEHNPFVLCR